MHRRIQNSRSSQPHHIKPYLVVIDTTKPSPSVAWTGLRDMPEELMEDILIHLPLDEPVCLVRGVLVCK